MADRLGENGITMKIYTRIVFDWDGRIIEADSYEYAGPIAELKGPSDLQKQTGQTDYSTAGGLQGSASNINQFLTPQLQQDVTNPQGIGQLGLNELQTSGGQAVAGQLGASNEEANLRA